MNMSHSGAWRLVACVSIIAFFAGSSPVRGGVATPVAWVPAYPPTPAHRPALVYDSRRDRLLQFGGRIGDFIETSPSTVWELSLSSPAARWSPLAVGQAPFSSFVGDAVYDSTSDRVIWMNIVGDQIWTLDLAQPTLTWACVDSSGTTASRFAVDLQGSRVLGVAGGAVYQHSLSSGPWAQIPVSGVSPPSSLVARTVLFDPVRNRLLAYGGTAPNGVGHDPSYELWAFDLATSSWSQLPRGASRPSAHQDLTPAYDPYADRFLFFGGVTSTSQYTDELWAYSPAAQTWSQLGAAAPQARSLADATMDTRRRRLIVFGGRNAATRGLNDLWAFGLDGVAGWTPLSPQGLPPSPRYGAATAYDPLGNRMFVFGGFAGAPDAGLWTLGLGSDPDWSVIVPEGTPPLARYFATLVSDPAQRRLLLFGGYDGSQYRNDLWALSLDGVPAWSLLVPAGVPPSPRAMHSAVYDPVEKRMIVFGGESDFGVTLGDMFELQLSGTLNWFPLAATGTPPPPRKLHAAVWQASSGRMVVFGGRGASSDYGDVWALSASATWQLLAPDGAGPTGRDGATVGHDPAADALVVLWGQDAASLPLTDGWSFDLGGTGGWTPLSLPSPGPLERVHAESVFHPTDGRFYVAGGATAGLLGMASEDAWFLQFPHPVSAPPSASASGSLRLDVSPNPAYGRLRVHFAGPPRPGCRVDVFALDGRRVASLFDGSSEATSGTIEWRGLGDRGERVPSGVYWIRLTDGRMSLSKRCAWLR